jgi:hypothetical protein
MGLQLPGELIAILSELGYDWPEADEELLFELGNRWMELAPQLGPIAARADAAANQVFATNQGEAVEAFRAMWTADDSALASLQDSMNGASTMGPLLMVAAAVVLALKINVIIQLTLLVIAIAQAIATAVVTAGASLLEIPIFKELTRLLVDMLIGMAIEEILG